MIVTNTDPGNLQVDGVYIDVVPAPPTLASGPATGLVAIVGGANYGPVNQPMGFSDGPSLASIFGSDTTSAHSLVRAALTAMPECTQFLGSRITDGTDTAATIVIKDASAGTVATLSARCTGSLPNGAASAIVTQQSIGAGSINPVFSVAINFPNKPTEVFSNINGFQTVGGVFNAPAFQANLLAAINGTLANKPGSVNWTAVAGSSTLAPTLGTAFTASGGTDGTASLATANLIGTDGLTGRTGMYALRGLISASQFILAALTDATVGQTLISFAVQENALAHLTFPLNTQTSAALATRMTDNLASPSLILSIDWLQVYDLNSGQTMFVDPMPKIAAVIASMDSYLSPGNQPVVGVEGIISTEKITNGINMVAKQEAAARQQSGLIYIGYMPRAVRGPQLGLPHGMTSDGTTRICDSRMLKYIVDELQAIEGALVDGPMSTVAGSSLGQPTAGLLQDAADAFFGTLLNGTPQQISAYQFLIGSQNTPASIAAGLLIPSIKVTTMSSAQFIVNLVQVGPNVQASVQTAA